jgi:hypothetical protein
VQLQKLKLPKTIPTPIPAPTNPIVADLNQLTFHVQLKHLLISFNNKLKNLFFSLKLKVNPKPIN